MPPRSSLVESSANQRSTMFSNPKKLVAVRCCVKGGAASQRLLVGVLCGELFRARGARPSAPCALSRAISLSCSTSSAAEGTTARSRLSRPGARRLTSLRKPAGPVTGVAIKASTLGARGRAGRRVLDQRLRQPRPHVRRATSPRRPEDVDRKPRHHRRHSGGGLVDRAFLARQPQQRLLGHVLSLRDAAEHPLGHAEAVLPQRLELANDGRPIRAHRFLLP